MTEEQETRCHQIIHTHAVAAAAGNIVPIPGLGVVWGSDNYDTHKKGQKNWKKLSESKL